MSEWKEVRIKNSSIEIIDGDRSSKYPKREEFLNEGVIFLNAASISGNCLKIENVNFISQNKFDSIKKGKVIGGDLIMTTRGNGVGDVAYYSDKNGLALINAQMLILRTNQIDINSKFLYYLFNSNEYKEEFINYSSGSAQPQLPISSLKEIPIKYPPLPTQQRIASILSAYDDLIENNLKRIKLLEEIAQRTYEEWFVKFRINGVQLEVSENGLPEGWETILVKDYVSIISKGPSLNYEYSGTKYPVINQSCIRNGEIELEKVLYAQELSENKNHCYLKINDILINSMGQGTLGRVSKNISIEDKFIIHNCILFQVSNRILKVLRKDLLVKQL
jgi:type I restriction enzyme S subunit